MGCCGCIGCCGTRCGIIMGCDGCTDRKSIAEAGPALVVPGTDACRLAIASNAANGSSATGASTDRAAACCSCGLRPGDDPKMSNSPSPLRVLFLARPDESLGGGASFTGAGDGAATGLLAGTPEPLKKASSGSCATAGAGAA
jgi:hypothetical protein